MVNIRGQLSSTKKILYLLFTVIFPYLKRKISGYLLKDPTGWKEKLLQFFNLLDKILLTFNLINFSIFIRYGKYRCLSQRILKIPM
jgi:hypothetical protein